MSLTKPIATTSPFNIAKAYQGFIEEPVPSTLFDAIESGATKKVLNFATTLIAFFAGVALVLLINSFDKKSAKLDLVSLPVDSLAISAHKAVATDVVHPVQVYADDMSHLSDWLAYRVGKDHSLKVLSAVGFTLVGASVIPDGSSASSLLVYENSDKIRLSLFTRYFVDSNDLAEPSKIKADGVNALRWEKNKKQQVLVASLSFDELEQVYRQLQN